MAELFQNTQLPAWLLERKGPFDTFNKGYDTGRRIAEDRQQDQDRIRRNDAEDALLPLKIADLQNKLVSEAQDIQINQLKQQNNLEAKAGLIELGQAFADAKWGEPDAMKRPWEIVSKYPQIMQTEDGIKAMTMGANSQKIAETALSLNQRTTDQINAKAESDRLKAETALQLRTQTDTANAQRLADRLEFDKSQAELKRQGASDLELLRQEGRQKLLESKIEADNDRLEMELKNRGFKFNDHAKLAAMQGEIRAINQQDLSNPNPMNVAQRQMAVRRVAEKYMADDGTTPAPAKPATTGTQFTVGQVVKQGGKTYKFDGKTWIEQP